MEFRRTAGPLAALFGDRSFRDEFGADPPEGIFRDVDRLAALSAKDGAEAVILLLERVEEKLADPAGLGTGPADRLGGRQLGPARRLRVARVPLGVTVSAWGRWLLLGARLDLVAEPPDLLDGTGQFAGQRLDLGLEGAHPGVQGQVLLVEPLEHIHGVLDSGCRATWPARIGGGKLMALRACLPSPHAPRFTRLIVGSPRPQDRWGPAVAGQ
jgi:hypothetical protein